MNKKIIIIILCAIIGIFIYINLSGDKFDYEEVNEEVKLLTEQYKTEFIVYGSELKFDNGCYARHIDKITKEALTSDPSYVYKILIINNMDETVTFDEEMVNIIKEEMNNNHLSVYYTGVDTTPYFKSGIENTINTGSRKKNILIGMGHEHSASNKAMPFSHVWQEHIYEDYKKGDHRALVDTIMIEATFGVRHFLG